MNAERGSRGALERRESDGWRRLEEVLVRSMRRQLLAEAAVASRTEAKGLGTE